MRTRIGWLGVLLTAAMLLVPQTLRAQTNDYDVPRADPVFPFPLYHDRPEKGGLFTSAEFNWYRMSNPLRHQLIAIRGLVDADGSILAALAGQPPVQPGQVIIPGVGNIGNFIGSGKGALYADDAGGEEFTPGWTITVGYRLESGVTVEASYMHLFNVRYIGGATLVPFMFQGGPLLADTFLFSPVFNFPPTFAGNPGDVGIGNPLAAYGIWNAASEETIKFEQRYEQYDLAARIPVCETECYRCYGLVGFRHAWIWERFKWRVVSRDLLGNATPEEFAVYSNIVSNPMYGPVIGSGGECYLGHGFSASLDCRVGLLADFVREIARYERGDRATEAKRSRRVFNLVPHVQADMNLWWYPIEGVEIRVGYNALAFFNTMSSPRPVSFNFAGIDPEYQHEFLRIVDGLHVGIGFIF